jgi:hypothetical protein
MPHAGIAFILRAKMLVLISAIDVSCADPSSAEVSTSRVP